MPRGPAAGEPGQRLPRNDKPLGMTKMGCRKRRGEDEINPIVGGRGNEGFATEHSFGRFQEINALH